MRAFVIYDSWYGNTEAIARAIAGSLREQCAVHLQKAGVTQPADIADDLLIVGGPTQKHRMSPAMSDFLDRLPRRSLRAVRAASFDTRYRLSRWLAGSAAFEISRSLKHAGAVMIDEPQSFFIAMDRPPEGTKRRHEQEQLEPGEIERARKWAAELYARVAQEAVKT